MTENQSGERSLTSPCGNVTVHVDPGSPPKVELTAGAERMFPRDLAELITDTARKASDLAGVAATAPESGPSLDEAIDMLAGLREELDGDGFAAAIDRRRAEFESPAERAERDQARFEGTPKLRLPDFALDSLDSTIGLLRRFKDAPPGTGRDAGEDGLPTGKATSPSKLVVVEATMEYPIASVWLSKRACEIGPKALTSEINETTAAALAELGQEQDAYFAELDLPLGPADVAGASQEVGDRGDRAVGDVRKLAEQQEHITRLFHQGGYFA
ncbi:hypothetical protein [Glycomyces salinus]|uniref:hypothetical protein n=1 Tax=Glycomyces salinus TaxID=980294 RepID=UPI0018ED232D|nr:hypothetical protein [Glycomyces salinus]